MPPSEPAPGFDGPASPLASELLRRGRVLVDCPEEQRGIEWHVEAANIGDLVALASVQLMTTRRSPAAG